MSTSLRFILQGISNDIAIIVMILMILGSLFFGEHTVALYVRVERAMIQASSEFGKMFSNRIATNIARLRRLTSVGQPTSSAITT